MKKLLKLSLVVIITMLLLTNCSFATSNDLMNALSQNMTIEDTILDGTNEVLYSGNDEGIMLINDDIEIFSDVIDSDVYLMQGNISIEKEVNGNIYVIGETVNISSSYINGNVFAIGKDVTINGAIDGSVYVMGDNITIGTESVDTVYAIGHVVNLAPNASIIGDLKVSSDTLNINGNINRELDAYIENINIGKSSEYIGKGNVSYATELSDPNGILESVSVTQHEKAEERAEAVKNLIIADKVRTEVLTILSTAIVIVVICAIVRNRKTENIENYSNEIVTTILKGFAWLIGTPILVVILMCTVLGIPVGVLLLVVYIIGIFIAVPVATVRIAEIICSKTPDENKAVMFLGAVCIFVAVELVSFIPRLGGLVKFLMVLYGIGSLIKYFFPKQNKTIDEPENNEISVISDENN